MPRISELAVGGWRPSDWCYVVALGSNMRHHRHGAPEHVLRAAIRALGGEPGLAVGAVSPILATPPLGPSRRRYANAAALVCTALEPEALLVRLQAIEAAFGRRRRGRRWTARVLDLDVLLWSGGAWASPALTIPHVALRHRRFALEPASAVAPRWRDPLTSLTVRHLHARLTRPRPLPIRGSWSGP